MISTRHWRLPTRRSSSTTPGVPLPFRGHDELKRFWEEWLENWDEYRVEPKELIEEGDEVFVASDQTGRASLTGIEVTQDLFQVFKLRDGVLVEP